MLAAAAAYTAAQGGSVVLALLAVALVFLPALAVSVTLVDWVVTLVVPPRTLPKLNLSGERGAHRIPDSCRTLVVVPAMLTSAPEVASLVQQIEQHYLRNPDYNLYFALLTDFGDAREQHLPGDAALLEQARAGIDVLNARYDGEPGAPGGPFCLFHRERRWNAQEGRWIGWERKRGKLHELNRWLRGATDTSITSSIGQAEQLRQVKYVITLDADTILGRDSARRLDRHAGPSFEPRPGRSTLPGGWCMATGCCSRVPRSRPPAPITLASAGSSPAMSGWISTPTPCPTSTRISLAAAATSAKAFTLLTPSRTAWPVVCPRIRCSAMICSRASMRGPVW